MALPEDTSNELQRSLSRLLKDDMGNALQDAVRPLLQDAFHRGAALAIRQMMRIGEEYLAALDALGKPTQEHDELADARAPGRHRHVSRRSANRRRRSSGTSKPRAASGAVGQAVDLVLVEHPGSRIIEIQEFVAVLDSTIARTSVTNELRRKKGTRYRQEGVRWYRIGDQEQRSGLARQLPVPGLLVGEAEAERSAQASPASRAA
jgi:hypothetical protein